MKKLLKINNNISHAFTKKQAIQDAMSVQAWEGFHLIRDVSGIDMFEEFKLEDCLKYFHKNRKKHAVLIQTVSMTLGMYWGCQIDDSSIYWVCNGTQYFLMQEDKDSGKMLLIPIIQITEAIISGLIPLESEIDSLPYKYAQEIKDCKFMSQPLDFLSWN